MTVAPPWLAPPLARLMALGQKMPHALLLHGPAGIGKRVLGRLLARALLCEADDPMSRPRGGCGACGACHWVAEGSHPDFRRLTSEVIALEEGIASDSEDAEDDDAEPAASKSRKAPSREIRVEQIRALQRFLSVGTHRSGSRVVLVYPLEAMNDIAANALLKMLEEPPPRTVFVLIADHLGRIPATVVSRCQRVPLTAPARNIGAAWLREQGACDEDLLALAGDAPFAALALAGDADAVEAHRALMAFLIRPTAEGALAFAETFGRSPPAPLVKWMQLWIADCLSVRAAQRLRYHPSQAADLSTLVLRTSADALARWSARLDAVRRTVDHPLNTRLMLEGLLTDYVDAVAPARSAAVHS